MDQQALKTPLENAKEKLGGNVGISRALDGAITPQAVSQWDKIPVKRAIELEAKTGIPRHELRPDIFGPVPQETVA